MSARDKFWNHCSRAEQLSLAAMAQAPTPGAVSRDAEKLALLEELKESIQRMERESAPTFCVASVAAAKQRETQRVPRNA